MVYEHRGRNREHLNVRVVVCNSNTNANDPVLARLDLEAVAGSDDDETIFCWEIGLDHIAALLGKRDETLEVVALASLAEGRHLVLLLRTTAASAALVVVLDVTARSMALRRWWPVAEDVVDLAAADGVVVCLGKVTTCRQRREC
jgi:hypothetical protein